MEIPLKNVTAYVLTYFLNIKKKSYPVMKIPPPKVTTMQILRNEIER